MNRYFYADSITNFVGSSENEILGALAAENSFDLVDLQRNAWQFEIQMLKEILRNKADGQILFEYSIPRLGKRIDVVLLLQGIVLRWNSRSERWSITGRIPSRFGIMRSI